MSATSAEFRKKADKGWASALFSLTLVLFYGALIGAATMVAVILCN